MRLAKLTPVGLQEVLRRVAEDGAPIAPDDLPPEALELVEPTIDLARVARRVQDWDGDAWSDARNAVELHQHLRLPRRVAADKHVWPWLAVCAFGTYTWRRFPRDDRGRFNLDRVRTDVTKNAIARLWWSAEQTRIRNPGPVCRALGLADSDDPYVFTRRLFRVLKVHQALTYRAGLMTRPFVAAFLSLVERMETDELPRRDVDDLAWESNLLFSSVVLDAYDAFGDADHPDAVSPDSCVALRDFLQEALFDVAPAPPVDVAPTASRVAKSERVATDAASVGSRAPGGLRGLFDRLRRRGG